MLDYKLFYSIYFFMEFSVEWRGRKHLKELLDPDLFYLSFQQKGLLCIRRSTGFSLRARREVRKNINHGLYMSSTTSAVSLTLLAYTAASGRSNRRENLDVNSAAAPRYREMGRSWTTLSEIWGTWAGPCPREGSLESPGLGMLGL